MRWLACLFLALASACFAQDQIFADQFDGRPTQWGCHPVRTNLGVSFTPPAGGSDLKMRMEVQALPVRKGEELFGSLIGQGGTPPYAFALVPGSGSLPSGISLASDGTLSGTPDTVEYAQFIAQVQDSALGVYQCRFAINVIPQLQIVDGTPPPFISLHTADYQLSISGATGAVTYALVSGSFPGFVSVSSSGHLGGNVGFFAGSSDVVVRATDTGSGDTIDLPFTFWVYSQPTIDDITTSVPAVAGSLYNITEGVPFVVTLTIKRDASLPQDGLIADIRLETADTPEGWFVARSGATAVLTFTPAPGSSALTSASPLLYRVYATDAYGGSTSQLYGLTILPQQGAVQAQLHSVPVGQDGAYKLNFTGTAVTDVDNDGETITVTIDSGGGSSLTPDGDTIEADTAGFISLTDSQRSHYGTATSTSSGPNDYDGTMTPTPAAYAAGSTYRVTFSSANTGAATLSLDGLPAKAIQLRGSALTGGEIPAGSTLELQYDGTQFQIVGGSGSAGATGPGYLATSTTSLATAGSGSKAFTTQAGLAYTAGARIRATSVGTGEWMEGIVTAYSSTTLTVTMDSNSGTSTHADWNINLAGQPGTLSRNVMVANSFTSAGSNFSTSSTSNVDLLTSSGGSTVSGSFTKQLGTSKLLVRIAVNFANTGSSNAIMTFSVSNGTTDYDVCAARSIASGSPVITAYGEALVATGLAAGTYTLKIRVRVSVGTGTFTYFVSGSSYASLTVEEVP